MGRASPLTVLLSRGACALAVLALAMRVLIPAGYMLSPQVAQGGLPAIVICTGHGALTVAVDADGQVHKSGEKAPAKSADKHPCAFAGAAAPLDAPTGLDLGRSVFATVSTSTVVMAHQRPGLGLAAPPPPTTGPPLIV